MTTKQATKEVKETREKTSGKKGDGVMRFRLKKGVGTHFEPNPDFDRESPESEDNVREIMYEPGSVVRSRRNLAKVFENKFVPYDKMARGEEDEEAVNADAENKKAKEENVKLSKKAEEEGADDPHEAEWKATRTSNKTPSQRQAELRRLEADLGADEDDEEVEGLEDDDFGEDVTEDFEDAGEDLKVFKKGSRFYVTDSEKTGKALSSKKGIKRTEVRKFIRKRQRALEE